MKSKKLSRVCYCLAGAVLLAALATTAVSFVLRDLRHYVQKSLDTVAAETGYAVTIEDISLSFAVGSGIKISALRIVDRQHNLAVLTCDSVHLLAELLPLLRRHLVVSRLVLTSPQCTLDDIDRAKPLAAFFFTPATPPPGETPTSFFDFSYVLKKLFIRNGRITVSFPPGESSLECSSINGKIVRRRRDPGYTVNIAAHMRTRIEPSQTALEGTATFTAQDVVLPSGTIDASHIACRLAFENVRLNRATRALLTLPRTVAACSLSLADRTLQLDNLSIKTGDIATLRGRAALKITPTGPHLQLAAGTDWVSPALLLQCIDTEAVLGSAAAALAATLHSGTVRCRDLRMDGLLPDLAGGDMQSLRTRIDLRDIRLTCFDQPLHIGAGRLKLANNVVSGTVQASIAETDNHTARFIVSDPFTEPDLHGTIRSSVPAGAIETILNRSPVPNGLWQIQGGSITAETSVRTRPCLTVTATGDLTGLQYGAAGCVKPTGTLNTLRVAATRPASQQTAPLNIDFQLGPQAAVSLQRTSNTPGILTGTYLLDGLDLRQIRYPFLGLRLQLCGRAAGSGRLRLPLSERATPQVSGTLRLDGLELSDRSDAAVLLHTDLHTVIDNGTAADLDAAVRFGATSCRVQGTLGCIAPPRGDLDITAELFDIDDFVLTVQRIMAATRNTRAHAPHSGPPPANLIELRAPLHIEKVNFLNWTARGGETLFSYRNGVMRWDDVVLPVDNGTIAGMVEYDLADMRHQRLTLDAARSDVDILWAVPGLREKQPITGTIDLRGRFTSAFMDDSEIAPNMHGDFSVTLRNGRISKFTVISKILSMFSIQRILRFKPPELGTAGMPYSQITADFTLAGQAMRTENFLLKSDAMNMSAVGTLDIATETMDFTVAAQPLQAVGNIVGRIPIAGRLLTGRDRALTVGYFRLSGPFSEPSVAPMPMKSVGSGVRKIFSTLLSLPRDIITFPFDNNSAVPAGQ